MSNRKIDCALMRGGTSKGVVLCAEDLPTERAARLAVLEQLLGSDMFQADGIGGGHLLNSKAALVSKSKRADADIDYKFVQVQPGRGSNDTVVCGNMLSAVGPYALATGLVPATDPQTRLLVHDINFGSLVEVILQTPGGELVEHGDYEIAGVPNTAAPIQIRYLNIAPGDSALWPTGHVCDVVDGQEISLVNAPLPVLIVSAAQLGWDVLPGFRDMNNRRMIEQILQLRDKTMAQFGLPHNHASVVPKIAVVARATDAANLAVRYFTPHNMHRSMAVSGAIAVGYAAAMPGTVAAGCAQSMDQVRAGTTDFVLEHVVGSLALHLMFAGSGAKLKPHSASLIRTARMIMRGTAYLPATA